MLRRITLSLTMLSGVAIFTGAAPETGKNSPDTKGKKIAAAIAATKLPPATTPATKPPATTLTATSETPKKLFDNKPAPTTKNSTPISTTPSSKLPAEIAAKSDKLLQEEILSSTKESIANKCNDETFLRRVTLDLTGVIPTPEELTRFTLDASPTKRADAIDRLLANKEFGHNWGHYWRDVILARRSEERAMLVSQSLTEYMEGELNKNTPWDQVARDFITAKGDVRENGATAIYMAQMGNTEDVTSEITRIFMGVQISCANCHNHPTDRWQREQFHELAAFFPRVEVRRDKSDILFSYTVTGLDRDPIFKGNNMIPRASAEHYMTDLKNPAAKGTRMEPVFFATGEKLSPGKTDEDRRKSIADWMTSPKNEWFSKAIINRLWSELVGEGFYEPVDDIGPDRQCTAPKTLDMLAQEFVGHGHDVKWLYRTILLTAAYQRESRSRHNPGETPFVASAHQTLRADQIYTSLSKALGFADTYGDTGMSYRPGAQVRNPRAMFNNTFNYDPSVRRDEVSGSIPQALMMMNSRELSAFERGNTSTTALGKLLNQTKNDESVAVELYLRCLAREPQETELKPCLEYVKKTGNRVDAFEDILWALVNSTEFLHRK